MGPLEENSISELTLRPINPDGSYGDPIALENVQNLTTDEIEWEGFENITQEIKYVHMPLTFSGTIIFHYKKMSRKKFKKWLMHLPGHNRNYAEKWCRIIKLLNGLVSYGESYQAMALDPSGLLLLDSITIKLEETK